MEYPQSGVSLPMATTQPMLVVHHLQFDPNKYEEVLTDFIAAKEKEVQDLGVSLDTNRMPQYVFDGVNGGEKSELQVAPEAFFRKDMALRARDLLIAQRIAGHPNRTTDYVNLRKEAISQVNQVRVEFYLQVPPEKIQAVSDLYKPNRDAS